MLQLRETRVVRSTHMPVVSGITVAEEGMALVYAKENGETRVQPSTGVAGEVFAGVSLSRNSHPAELPYIQEQAIPANGVLTLVRTPIANQLLVKVAGVQVTVVPGAPADATQVQLAGADLVFFNGEAGKQVSAQFKYTPSVIEARTVMGDAPIGGLPSTAQSVIGVLKDAVITTNFFDASQDWSLALHAKLGANGMFVPANAAQGIPGVVVHNAPNAANPFLSLSMNVA